MDRDKGQDEYIFCSEAEAKQFIEIIVDVTDNVLKSEAQIEIVQKVHYLNNIAKLELKDITSMISIDDKYRMNLIFTFDEKLLNYITKNYTAGMDFEGEKFENVLGETAGDIINIVIGLSIGKFARTRRIFNLSTPVIIHKAIIIPSCKDTTVYSAEISSKYGSMILFVVVPGARIKNQIMSVNLS